MKDTPGKRNVTNSILLVVDKRLLEKQVINFKKLKLKLNYNCISFNCNNNLINLTFQSWFPYHNPQHNIIMTQNNLVKSLSKPILSGISYATEQACIERPKNMIM